MAKGNTYYWEASIKSKRNTKQEQITDLRWKNLNYHRSFKQSTGSKGLSSRNEKKKEVAIGNNSKFAITLSGRKFRRTG